MREMCFNSWCFSYCVSHVKTTYLVVKPETSFIEVSEFHWKATLDGLCGIKNS